MECGLAVARHPVQDLLVRLDGGAGRRLTAVVLIHRRLTEDVARDLDRLDPFAPVLVGREVVEAEGRVLARIAALERERAARVGIHRAYVDLIAVALRAG